VRTAQHDGNARVGFFRGARDQPGGGEILLFEVIPTTDGRKSAIVARISCQIGPEGDFKLSRYC